MLLHAESFHMESELELDTLMLIHVDLFLSFGHYFII